MPSIPPLVVPGSRVGTSRPPVSGRRLPTYPARVLGTGVHAPGRLVASAELDARYGREPGTTFARSGVRQRRWATPDETSSGMAASALQAAVRSAGLEVSDLDAVVVSCIVPEQPMPTTAVLVLGELGLTGGRAEAFDVNASCLGFLTAFQVAALGVAAGQWRHVGVVATEIASKGLNHADIESSALFGDGAGAVVVGRSGPGEQSTVHGLRFATWPEGARFCRIDAGGTRWNAVTPPPEATDYLFRMDGHGILKHAATRLPRFLAELFADTGIGPADVDVVVPHQASGVGLRYLRERLGFDRAQIVDVLGEHGNQVSASLPTALHHAVSTGVVERGRTVLVIGTGAGFTVGAALLTY